MVEDHEEHGKLLQHRQNNRTESCRCMYSITPPTSAIPTYINVIVFIFPRGIVFTFDDGKVRLKF